MSRYGLTLSQQAELSGLPVPVCELRFAPPRRWRFDYAWTAQKLACEVEGGVWRQGRHTRGAGYTRDLEKYNEATLRGWRLLRVTPTQVASGAALTLIARALHPINTHEEKRKCVLCRAEYDQNS